MEEKILTPVEYWKRKARFSWLERLSVVAFTSFLWWSTCHHSYRPYGRLSSQEARAEVLIHRTDIHKVYTCEEDPIVDDLIQGHYAVLDQIEALDAGYTPMGQGYCQ